MDIIKNYRSLKLTAVWILIKKYENVAAQKYIAAQKYVAVQKYVYTLYFVTGMLQIYFCSDFQSFRIC